MPITVFSIGLLAPRGGRISTLNASMDSASAGSMPSTLNCEPNCPPKPPSVGSTPAPAITKAGLAATAAHISCSVAPYSGSK